MKDFEIRTWACHFKLKDLKISSQLRQDITHPYQKFCWPLHLRLVALLLLCRGWEPRVKFTNVQRWEREKQGGRKPATRWSEDWGVRQTPGPGRLEQGHESGDHLESDQWGASVLAWPQCPVPGCRCSLVLYPAPLPARLIPASLRSIRVCCRKTVATRCKVPGRSRYHTVELILTKKGVHSCLYLIAHSNLTKIYLRKCCNRLAMLNVRGQNTGWGKW